MTLACYRKDYANFAETCFQKFGDRVKFWITMNEPYTVAVQGYDFGRQAPGHCSLLPSPLFCKIGNSAIEPYIVAHNFIRSHAAAADIYRKRYKGIQGGSIGTILNALWFVPATNTERDIVATQRAKDFMIGWFLDPFVFGDYPSSMKSRVGIRLPKFSQAESAIVKGSLDFVGINHFTTYYVKDDSMNITKRILKDALTDTGAVFLPFNGTHFIGEMTNSLWVFIAPEGIRSLMNYIRLKYGNLPIFITESGLPDLSTRLIPVRHAYFYLNDLQRIRYHSSYLPSLLASIKDGCNVKGYFVWALLDNWEWDNGYSARTGLYYVDYTDNLKRYPKKSAVWYKNFLKPTVEGAVKEDRKGQSVWDTFSHTHGKIVDFSNDDIGVDQYHRFKVCYDWSGNSATEPYIVGHNILRSHATVADIYRKKYKDIQGGSIGTILSAPWLVSATNTEKDIVATQRAKDFMIGWFLDPLIFGDYPSSMKSRVGNRLPKFSQAEAALVKGSLDFLGISHFTSLYVKDNSAKITKILLNDAMTDHGAIFLPFNGTHIIGEIVEGAVKEDGKGQSVWDTFSHTPGKILDFSNDDIGVDQYHRFKEDIQLMKDLRTNAYRFSISWPRIFPNGSGEINDAGVDHYNEFINALVAEERTMEILPRHAFRNSGIGSGNSATEPYIVGHNILRSHATVADIYRKKYKNIQGGSIGTILATPWFVPATNAEKDIVATQRAKDFMLGWFLDPLIFGDYPCSMKSRVGSRLPKFSQAEAALLKGSLDFVGINHFTTYYVKDDSINITKRILKDALTDNGALFLSTTKSLLSNPFISAFNGTNFIGEITSSTWLYIVPEGIRSLMNYIKQKYGNIPIIITENGMSDVSTPFISIKYAYAYLNDVQRIRYHSSYLSSLLASIKDGCNVKGYFTWSLLDCWGWETGYSSRTGLYYVDYTDNLKRYPKKSAVWYKNFLKPTN
ncbi:hypothetical protein TanjilG_28136 [Lupinus angustifolius]|uniref:Beta-glucosidase n=1 Tax=Lupinus angustifolius TaxID=3871 RepID=A0A1J7G190_LUPAN|nr:hypothetical protein TanjilG_28136 [Lupinus angustifolius]